MEVFDFAAIASAAALSTLAAAWWMLRTDDQAHAQQPATAQDVGASVSFLFEEDMLHHASETAARLYQLIPGQDDWDGVRSHFLNRFPSLPESPRDAPPGSTVVAARDLGDAATLRLTRDGIYTRVSMHDNGGRGYVPPSRLKALYQELEDLKRASDTTPHAVWQLDSEGKVSWHNLAYADLYERLHGSPPDAAVPVFEIRSDFDATNGSQRVSTQIAEDGQKDWYDVSAVSVADITIFHAIDVNAVVKSEIAQRNFVQTLAKTFAQLSIGLAIFDRNGRLALFNPALIDLTDLPAEFLSGRPNLMSFFDRIRESRRMPEPKNYASWRQEIADVISAATDGRYEETWTLETGQTYRVNGRPHPDGAIAFLIEDISAEISLTRNFRAELELGQSLMDTLDDAVVVFSSAGVVTFCNLAYRELWGVDPDNSFADVTVADALLGWKSLCVDGPDWTALSDFVLTFGDRTPWTLPLDVKDGPALICTVTHIASGATVVRFSDQSAKQTAVSDRSRAV
ncbi:MAG: PAS-domain containing protein [Pseudomonadota bacterium]